MYHKWYMTQTLSSKLPRDGSTVVELIVVIVVIGILATISFVSYSQVRRDAQKSSYEATAQQIKLKLSQHYTDNNYYPRLKSNVQTYLTSVNSDSALVTEFAKSEYAYTAYTNSAATTACSTNAACQFYRITVNKSNWAAALLTAI